MNDRVETAASYSNGLPLRDLPVYMEAILPSIVHHHQHQPSHLISSTSFSFNPTNQILQNASRPELPPPHRPRCLRHGPARPVHLLRGLEEEHHPLLQEDPRSARQLPEARHPRQRLHPRLQRHHPLRSHCRLNGQFQHYQSWPTIANSA